MSEKQEHRRRYNRRLQYVADFDRWQAKEPGLWCPRWLMRFWPRLKEWKTWYESRPVWTEEDV